MSEHPPGTVAGGAGGAGEYSERERARSTGGRQPAEPAGREEYSEPGTDHLGGFMTRYAEGDRLPTLRVTLNRTDVVRYTAASGDLNPIHWSDRVARSVELPGVVVHGMFTMALAGRLVTGWLGDPGAIRSVQARFTRPVPVPDVVEGVDPPGGAAIELTGTLTSIATLDGVRTGTVDIRAVFEGRTVLGRASAVVALPARAQITEDGVEVT